MGKIDGLVPFPTPRCEGIVLRDEGAGSSNPRSRHAVSLHRCGDEVQESSDPALDKPQRATPWKTGALGEHQRDRRPDR